MVLGIDIGGTAIKYALVDTESLGVQTKTQVELTTDKPARQVLSILSKYPDICLVGIATAGKVDSMSGRIVGATANLKNWHSLNASFLRNESGKEVFLMNDANAAALAESRVWGCQNLAAMTIGTGLGGGVVIGGKVLIGSQFEASEFGHVILHPNGLACNCGKHGCAERYVRMKRLHEKTGIDLRADLIQAFQRGDLGVTQAVDQLIDDLCILIDHVFLMVSVEKLIISGGVTELGDALLPMIRQKQSRYTPYSAYGAEQIELGLRANDAGIIGAAIFAREGKGCLL